MMINNDVKDPVSEPAEVPQPVAVKKAPAKKAMAKKAATKRAAVKKPSAQKVPAKKAAAKKAPTKKAPAKKDLDVKAVAKKPSAKKPTAQKTSTKKPKVVSVEVAPAQKAKKMKLVRDSFTMPGHEYQVLQDIKKAALKAGIELKKSDLLRIGVSMLKNFSITQLDKARAKLTKLRAGRPKK
jgi:hypothetical protein